MDHSRPSSGSRLANRLAALVDPRVAISQIDPGHERNLFLSSPSGPLPLLPFPPVIRSLTLSLPPSGSHDAPLAHSSDLELAELPPRVLLITATQSSRLSLSLSVPHGRSPLHTGDELRRVALCRTARIAVAAIVRDSSPVRRPDRGARLNLVS